MTPDTELLHDAAYSLDLVEVCASALAIALLAVALAWPPLIPADGVWRHVARFAVVYLALVHVASMLHRAWRHARHSRVNVVSATRRLRDHDSRQRESRGAIPPHLVAGLIACGLLLLLMQPPAWLSTTTTTPTPGDTAVTRLSEAVDRLGARLREGNGEAARGGQRSDAWPPETEITAEGEAIARPRPQLAFWLIAGPVAALFALGLYLSTTSVLHYGQVGNRYRKAVGLALSASSLFGGLTLVKLDTVSLALPPVAIELGRGASSYERLATISSFKPGVANQLEGMPGGDAEAEVTAASLTRVRGELRSAFDQQARGRTLRALMVVGFADRFEVRRTVRSRFGSNAGLARARADWVSAQAADRSSPFPRVDQIILTAGHGRHGDAAVSDTAVDRSVVIYAMWDETLRSRLNWLRPPSAPEPPRQTAAAP